MEEIKKVLIDSPIRKNIGDNIPFKKLISKNLDEIMESLEILEKKEKSPLNIVIVGEVKSGKSSLVNAILSKEVSEVDVLEATSSIIEISYGEKETRANIEGVEKVYLDREFLKRVNIVDTPGLKSITDRNEQKTLNYIQNADLILFLFDATHLGQEDIYDTLDLISTYKKPMAGIVNKADLLEDDRLDVLEYIKDEYSIYIEDFFMISAYMEYQDRISKQASIGDADLVISDYDDLRENFQNLDKYIEEVCNNCESIKDSSRRSSLEGIIHKEIIHHHDYLKSINIILGELNKYEGLIEKKCEYINDKMNFEISDWINRVFLGDELYKINDNIANARLYINEDYINDTINRKKNDLDSIYFKEWNECLKEIEYEVDESIKKSVDNIEYKKEILNAPNIKIDDSNINLNDLLATLGTGAVLGATSGGIISIYSSAIGSSAASLTIGNALLAYCPPLLIAGTITGGLGKLIYEKVKMEQKNNDIILEINRFVEQLKLDVAKSLSEGYENSSKEIIDKTKEMFSVNKGISIDKCEAETFCESIDSYIKNLEKYIIN